MLLRFIQAAVALLLIQCQDQGGNAFREDGTKADQYSGQNEAVVPPTNISGAYLTCATEIEPTQNVNSGVIGCRLSDKDNNKIDVDPRKVAYKITPPQNDEEIFVTELDAPADKRYDKLYFFLGNQTAAPVVRQVMNYTKVTADVTDENNQKKSLGGLISRISINKNSVKEPQNIDYSAVLLDEYEAVINGQKDPVNYTREEIQDMNNVGLPPVNDSN